MTDWTEYLKRESIIKYFHDTKDYLADFITTDHVEEAGNTVVGFAASIIGFILSVAGQILRLLDFIPLIFDFFIWGLKASMQNWFMFLVFIEIYIIIKSILAPTLSQQIYIFFNSQFVIFKNALSILEKIFKRVMSLIKALPFT